MKALIGQVGRSHDQTVKDQPRHQRGGAALLECVLALALFVACGMAVLAMVDHAVDSVAATRDAEQAADVARSAMARIEAGLATPQALNGPVTSWGGDEQDQKIESSSAIGAAWSLEVQTEPSQFEGLTRVTVRAIKQAAGSDSELASFTLHQLVRLTEKADGPLTSPAKPRARRSKS